jgi:pullulanase
MENLFGTADFESVYAYDGDLGALYTATKTIFRLWTPLAESVKVNLYATGSDGETNSKSLGVYDMTQKDKGVWETTVNGDIKNVYYTYTVKVQGVESEVVDPYAKAAGVNGKRGMVIDLDSTDPTGWENVGFLSRKAADSIIYEAHVRDLTIDPSSGVSENNRGKFLGMTEKNTKNSAGQSTALDHLIELGVTELHILPMFDYKTVDESSTEPQFNWGYDPMNYNVPEGSYSTNPYDGNVRIKELKEMVLALHNAGIRVVMDVVYNHTADSANSNFNLIMPGYYYRMVNGNFSNGSGCGNETASERAMYRKFMIDSVCYWAKEFKIDGFRFDLMGLHDIQTMNLLASELRKINSNALIYGEGWTGGTSGLAENKSALKKNAKLLDGIAVFSDDIRDSIKGSVFNAADKGFVSGKAGTKDGVLFGVYGASKTVGGYVAWANNPTQSINYASAHDNLSLADKIASSSSASAADRAKMTRLSAAIVFTSQGIPFFQAGEEMLRSKVKEDGTFDENSYKSSDAVNSIKWDLKSETEYSKTFEYYKGLIALRKAFPEFRLGTKEAVTGQIWEMTCTDTLVSYYIESESRDVIVAFNASTSAQTLDLGLDKTYRVFVEGNTASSEEIRSFTGKSYEMQPISACVLVREKTTSNSGVNEQEQPEKKGCGSVMGLGTVTLLAVAGVVAAGSKRKRKK